jgi:hypothetical protein
MWVIDTFAETGIIVRCRTPLCIKASQYNYYDKYESHLDIISDIKVMREN